MPRPLSCPTCGSNFLTSLTDPGVIRLPDRRLCLHCYSEFEVPRTKPRGSISPGRQKTSKLGAARKV